jgi:PAS domain S-box-containing protein
MEVEHYISAEDGTRFYQSRCVPEYGADGKVTNVLAVLHDLTERKRAEEELSRNRKWLRVMLSSIGDAVIATDSVGRVTFLNPVAVTLTGWRAEEATGQPVQNVFQIINGKTHTPTEDLVARVLSKKQMVGLANDTALVTKDGREVPIEDSAAPILDSAERNRGCPCVS